MDVDSIIELIRKGRSQPTITRIVDRHGAKERAISELGDDFNKSYIDSLYAVNEEGMTCLHVRSGVFYRMGAAGPYLEVWEDCRLVYQTPITERQYNELVELNNGQDIGDISKLLDN